MLWELAALVEAHAGQLACLESLDTGKPRRIAENVDVATAAAFLRMYAGASTRLYGQRVPMPDATTLCITMLEPVGVIAAVMPWNYPLIMAAQKTGAALAAGCSVVAKPAPETPLTALAFARLATDAGVPDGVVNVILGAGETGADLVGSRGIGKVSFTGSSRTGTDVLTSVAQLLRPATMELGGKSPNIVFGDVDLPGVAASALQGAVWNAGQECCAGARILVHDSVFEEFCRLAAEEAHRIVIGLPDDERSMIGPLISRRHRERVQAFVDRAISSGAESFGPPSELPADGFFFPVTLLRNVDQSMEICREEVFGPVVTIDHFSNDEEAIAKANDTRYGLAVGVWTSSIGRALRMIDELEAGQIWINSYLAGDPAAPFGGTKDSGYGQELGTYGVEEFTYVKTAYLAEAPVARKGGAR